MVETICSLQEEGGDGKAHCIVMVGAGSSNCQFWPFWPTMHIYSNEIEEQRTCKSKDGRRKDDRGTYVSCSGLLAFGRKYAYD